MAAPAWAIVGTRLSAADALTGWDAGNINTDDQLKQGNAAIGQKISAALAGFGYTHGSTFDVSGANRRCVYIWMNCLSRIDTLANGGLRVYVGNDASNRHEFYVAGSDNYTGGWRKRVISPRVTPTSTTGTPNLTTVDYFAGFFNVLASIMGNFNNALVDAVDLLEAIRMTAGDVTTPGTFARFATFDTGTLANQYGVIREEAGVFFIQGRLYIGDGATTTLFDDRSGAVVVFEDTQVDTDFYEVQLTANATLQLGELSGGAPINGATILSSGPGWHLNLAAGTANLYGCTFGQFRVATLSSSVTAQACTFKQGGTITAAGADLIESQVLDPTVAADGSAVGWDIATNPNGLLDGMLIQKGAAAHHAIGFGTNAPLTMTLTDITLSGFNASDGADDSALLFPDTGSDVTWNINVVNGTGTFSYKKTRAGDTVNIIAPVIYTLTNLTPGTEVRVFRVSDDVELDGVESSGATFAYAYTYTGDVPVYINIQKFDKLWQQIRVTLGGTSETQKVTQLPDLTASNPP